MAVEIYSAKDIRKNGFARVLILGRPKTSGKTILVASTAPKPLLFLNCDGADAQLSATRFSDDFDVIDIDSPESLEEACEVAVSESAAGHYRSVALDTFTLLVNVILSPHYRHKYRHEKDVGFSTYRETRLSGIRALKRLVSLRAHLFITGHEQKGELNCEGSLKEDLPGLVHEIAYLSYDEKRDPQRQLKVNSRRADGQQTCAADLGELLKVLGLETT